MKRSNHWADHTRDQERENLAFLMSPEGGLLSLEAALKRLDIPAKTYEKRRLRSGS